MRERVVIRALALSAFAVIGCQAIAGIEDRHYVPSDGGAKATDRPLCKKYCKEVTQACTEDNVQYADEDVCLAVCAHLDLGNASEPGGDTVACRENQARLALIGEPERYCTKAGPGGAGTCGSDCKSYCDLFASICSKIVDPLPNCVESCQGLRREKAYTSNVGNFGGNSLDCRIYHVNAAASDAEMHCPHAQLVPATAPCADDPDKTPSCDDYCKAVMVACGATGDDGGSHAVYDNEQQCLDTCKTFPVGLNRDTMGDSVGCRLYHSFNAFADPVTHCPHAGPGGDGVCSGSPDGMSDPDNCESYCEIVNGSCPAEFKSHFSSPAACVMECEALPGAKGNSGYSTSAPDGNTLQCRLVHATRAFSDKTLCPAALGSGACK